MKIANLFAVFVVNDVAQTTVVDALRPVFRVPDNFIDEVAEVKHEPEAILFRSAFVLENHSPVRILSPLVRVLARDERKPHRSFVVIGWCRNGPADAAAVATHVSKAIPVRARRLQSAS